jgi:hypothetical protein
MAFPALGRSLPGIIGIGALMGISTSILTATGGRLRPWRDPERDILEEREALRKNYRRPVEETIAELGEGRGRMFLISNIDLLLTSIGIYGPGYAERRKQRIKENYGIDVP